MPTRVANIRQSIVFRIEVYQPAPRSTQGFKRGIKTVGMTRYRETLPFEKFADRVVGTVLLVSKLGVRPDLTMPH